MNMKAQNWSMLALACVVACAACESDLSIGEKAARDQILLFDNGAEPKDLDPHIVTGLTEHNIISALLEGLVSLDPNTLEPQPATAESWKITQDGRVYTFTIRETARWSNGDAVTAHDFEYSWRRLLTPELGAEYAYQLYVIKNAKSFNLGKLKDFNKVGIKAIDERTLRVELAHPTNYFLSLLDHFSAYPVHRKTIENFGGIAKRGSLWTRPKNYVGNGPFKLDEWRINYRIHVVNNPRYWDSKSVKIKGISFLPIEKAQTAERMFRIGALHITNHIPSDKIEVYRQKYADEIRITPYLGTYYYLFNTTQPPLDDARVRRALSMAIERKKIVDHVTKGGQIPALSLTPPNTGGYTSKPLIREDIAEARRLLAEAGHPNGENLATLQLLYNTSDGHRKIAVTLQEMWRKNLGIKVQLVNQDWKVYLASRRNLNFAIARAGWIGDYPDPKTFLNMFTTGSGNNDTGWNNARYDQLIKYSDILSGAARNATFQEAEQLLMDESPIMPIYIYTSIALVTPKLRGWASNILNRQDYKRLHFSQLPKTTNVPEDQSAPSANAPNP